jgi:hypothetical protein
MQHSDLKLLSLLGIILGAFCLAGGAFAYWYEVPYYGFLGVTYVHPYQAYTIPLGFAGVFLLTVGLAADYKGREEQRTQERKPTDSLGYCPNCGTKRDPDSKYCKNCGRKF